MGSAVRLAGSTTQQPATPGNLHCQVCADVAVVLEAFLPSAQTVCLHRCSSACFVAAEEDVHTCHFSSVTLGLSGAWGGRAKGAAADSQLLGSAGRVSGGAAAVVARAALRGRRVLADGPPAAEVRMGSASAPRLLSRHTAGCRKPCCIRTTHMSRLQTAAARNLAYVF